MKNNLSVLTIFLFVLVTSCSSDKLTKEKVRDLYKECYEKGETQYAEKKIVLGKKTVLNKKLNSQNSEENYNKLKAQDLISFEKLATSFMGYPEYNISLTEKGKSYISQTTKKGAWTTTMMKCFSLELDEIKEIHEIPEQNVATIKATFKKVNKTPFIILMSEKSNNNEVIEKTIGLKKTNEGWKLCD
ncbi:hypothetical protein [Tenacibaculum maritimum]|uniref:hypothetical protein n=1 Tax=Tenacibaculum maritimum TaxID=107401 RepID=UPI0012E6879E|nr:hypothetical protein [Tenacibaculum maritimum]CAA0224503.1 conserved hypothetical protein [Tenacibaculum maritimum]